MPAARLDWKTVVWTLAQSSPPGLLSHQSEHELARHSWGAFPRSLDHAGYELGGPIDPRHIIALDIKRSEDQDILRGDLYSQLCVSAWNGNIQGMGGGPNCRTWSILRWFPKPGFPKPVRGRQEPDCWGFSVLEASEANDTDNDSLLLLRQLLLSHISKMRYKGPGLPWCFYTQRIPSCARPVPVPIDAPPYGRPKPFRHGAGRWASP